MAPSDPGLTAKEAAGSNQITVEVAYALPQRQCIKSLQVRAGCTALEAVLASGIVQEFPEIDVATVPMGIFAKLLDGKTLPLPSVYELKAGDRVELYRPLIADPKAIRQQRAAKARQLRTNQD